MTTPATNPNPGFTIPVWLPFNASTLGNNNIITGYSDTPTIQILGLYLQCGTTTTITFKGGSTAFTGSMTFATGGSFQVVYVNTPYFQCNNGDDFIINLGGITGSCGGAILYNQF